MYHIVDGGHFLEVDGDDADGGGWEEAFFGELLDDDLAPAAGSGAEVDGPLSAGKDAKDVVDLKEFVSRAGAKLVFLGLAVVNVLG